MDSADLGPAMALSGASDEGSRKALKAMSAVAYGVESKLRAQAAGFPEPQALSVMNIAAGWRIFADDLKEAAR